MSSQILHAAARGKGISFHFNYPKTGLSLRSVAIEDDGLPKLVFDAAKCRDLPTLTEEDVATVARVVIEGKRPEFVYTDFLNPSHPFIDYGRAYKLYSPQWLRGTSVGELLSEADWAMKCLHVGTRSNPSKTDFWSWQKTSKLEGLAVYMDFPREQLAASIFMSCKFVETEQSNNEILFIKEPKMQIRDTGSSMYSEYITEYYYNIAYYDEPLFLKMQELIKLIVAVEWMKEKGIKFKEKWMKYHTEKKKKAVAPISVQSMSNTEELIEQIVEKFTTPQKQLQDGQPTGPHEPTSTDVKVKTQTATGAEIEIRNSYPTPLPQEVVTVRVSFNDYNFLYEGIDCQMPISYDKENGVVTPDVKSWSELFAETVPMPITIRLLHNDMGTVANTNVGGVTTRNIPIQAKISERVRNTEHETTSVKASTKINCSTPLATEVPQVKEVDNPPTKIPAHTLESKCNAVTKLHGTIDCHEERMHTDKEAKETQDCRMTINKTIKMDGKTTSRIKFGYVNIRANKKTQKEKGKSHAQNGSQSLPTHKAEGIQSNRGNCIMSEKPVSNQVPAQKHGNTVIDKNSSTLSPKSTCGSSDTASKESQQPHSAPLRSQTACDGPLSSPPLLLTGTAPKSSGLESANSPNSDKPVDQKHKEMTAGHKRSKETIKVNKPSSSVSKKQMNSTACHGISAKAKTTSDNGSKHLMENAHETLDSSSANAPKSGSLGSPTSTTSPVLPTCKSPTVGEDEEKQKDQDDSKQNHNSSTKVQNTATKELLESACDKLKNLPEQNNVPTNTPATPPSSPDSGFDSPPSPPSPTTPPSPTNGEHKEDHSYLDKVIGIKRNSSDASTETNK